MEFTDFYTEKQMSLQIEDHKTASESMRNKCVCQEWDRNISLIIDSAFLVVKYSIFKTSK